MNSDLIFLDAEIPFGAAGPHHDLKDACERILRAAEKGDLRVAIDAEVIQEVIYRCGFLRAWDLGLKIANCVLALTDTVYAISAKVVQTMVDLIDPYALNGFPALVLIHTAVMKHKGLTRGISFDTHFDQVPEFNRLDPVTFAAGQRL